MPEGKFKAYLKKSPGTYRIVTQKADNGKQVPEGTLLFDPATNTLNIALGKKFDDADPAAVFALNPANAATTPSPDMASTTEVKVKSKKEIQKQKQNYFFILPQKLK